MRPFLVTLFMLVGCEADPGKSATGPERSDISDTATSNFEGDEAGECTDEADNDRDGLFDCDDPDCAGAPECQETDDADGGPGTDADADADADGSSGGDTSSPPVDTGSTTGSDTGTTMGGDTATVDTATIGTETGTDTAEPPPAPIVSGIPARLGPRDYGYLFWPGNHWVTWGSYTDVQHIQTGYYGMAFDVSAGSFDHLGLITEAFAPEAALLQDNSIITGLPEASVRYAVVPRFGGGGIEHIATAFKNREGTTSNPSELVDMGRFMQRVDIPRVEYADSTYTGSIHLAAMTRHFVLTHKVTTPGPEEEVGIKIELRGTAVTRFTEVEWLEGTRAVSIRDDAGEGWTFIIPTREGATPSITRFPDGNLIFEQTYRDVSADESIALNVIAIPSHAGDAEQVSVWLNPGETVQVRSAQMNRDGSGGTSLTPATWDPERGLYQITLGDLSAVGAPRFRTIYTTPSGHNWYNRHRIVVENDNSSPVSIPIAFDGGGNAAIYITGGIPLLRSTDGEPIGVPVQISKNWHDPPEWYHLYSTMELPPGSHEFEHTFAHSKWGEAYAAQHAQLSLIGWGRNQQWDESSLGCWGESITYDPDMTLGRSQVDDVRPFLVDAGGEWRWTGNVGGASFLVYEPSEGFSSFASHQLGRMKTHYEYTGPNLTNVHYAGITADQKIEAKISTQLGRTDDLVRAYYHLEYTFVEDVHYDRIAFFQMAADRYSDNGFSQYAYGNEDGVIFDAVVPDHRATGYSSGADRGIALTGESPWVMAYNNLRTEGDLPEHLANIGFVIRDYEANIGGTTITTPHINIIRTYNHSWSQMGFELGLPYTPGDTMIPAGSTVRATVEYLIPPADKGRYFGDSRYLTELPASMYQNTEMMRMLAADNRLTVEASIGTLVRSQPVEVEAVDDTTAVQFTLTGGLGYTPVTIHGLARPDGWRLEQRFGDVWERVDQSVEGNDYWQAYDDAASGSFELVFNVFNQGTTEYRLVR